MKAVSARFVVTCEECGITASGRSFVEQCRIVLCRCGLPMHMICFTASIEIEDTE